MDAPAPNRLPRAWYSAPFSEFLAQSTEEVIGHLARNSALNIDTAQRDAWAATILLLKQHLAGHKGHLLLEFNIPRMGARADAVLLLAGCVVVLEFKVGETSASTSARNQVWEYALDTKNFHEPIPPGSEDDGTRPPGHYNSTYQYFRSVGLQEV